MLVGLSCSNKESPPSVIHKKPIGKIVDANVIPTSFNESIKTQIKTEKRFVVIYGINNNIIIGNDAYIITYDNGKSYITWDGTSKKYRIRKG